MNTYLPSIPRGARHGDIMAEFSFISKWTLQFSLLSSITFKYIT